MAELAATDPRPRLSAREAQRLATDHWAPALGRVEIVEPLPSYDDQNWLLHLAGDKKAVLKIAAAGAECRGGADATLTKSYLACEHAMMRTMRQAGVDVPEPVPSGDGAEIVAAPWRHLECFARVVTFVDGEALSELRGRSDDGLLAALGRTLGATDFALATLEPRADGADAEERFLAWDLANAATVSRPYLDDLDDEALRARVARGLDDLDALLASPAYASLPRQLIHGDANDENVFCAKDGIGAWRVAFIDFGDYVRTARIFDLAILLAYALFDGKGGDFASLLSDMIPDPAASAEISRRAAVVARAFHAICPLRPAELDALPALIRARNCQTILNAAHGFKLDPDPYRLVSADPAKRLLRQLDLVEDDAFRAELRDACGYS